MRTIFVLIRNIWVILFSPLWFVIRKWTRPRAKLLVLTIHPEVEEFNLPPTSWQKVLSFFSSQEEKTSLEDLRQKVSQLRCCANPVSGVVIKMSHLQAGWAICQSLRSILLEIRALGKELTVCLTEGGGMPEFYVASAASKITMTPYSSVSLKGMSVSTPYLRSFLNHYGIEVDVFSQGTYKTAAEPLVRDGMSDAQKEQLSSILQSLHEEVAQALVHGRKLDRSSVDEVFTQGLSSAEEAFASKIVDQLAYYDQIVPEDDKQYMSWNRFARWHHVRFWRRLRSESTIAVIALSGTIVDKATPSGVRKRVIEPQSTSKLLKLARTEPRIKGVVLKIDSPGGSAASSDLIHRQVTLLAEKKPVVAYFSNVAASGGYYIATAASTIVAQGTTMTGSIGVFAIRPRVTHLLEKQRIYFETMKTAPSADLFSPLRPPTEQEKERIRAHVRATYDRFIQVVSEGRKISKEEADQHAQGRVFLGVEAKNRGLVDQIGDLKSAVDAVREKLPEKEKNIPISLLAKPAGLEELSSLAYSSVLLNELLSSKPLFYAWDLCSLQ